MFFLFPGIGAMDKTAALYINKKLHNPLSRRFFPVFWQIGTTPAAVIFLISLSIRNLPQGLSASAVFLGFAALERWLKISLARPRPFETLPHQIHFYQPKQPTDPSFPSGDCLRVWFAAVLSASLVGWSWFPTTAFFLLAGIVTLGRVTMGAHYPLDTAGGLGLGLLSSSLVLLIWNSI
jgi:membrane-associated phospholipid phosphatase